MENLYWELIKCVIKGYRMSICLETYFKTFSFSFETNLI